jgi:hypothetical protein
MGFPKQEYQKLAAATVFAVAMGFLESAVVVYLRLLYCPEGFGFPLRKFMDPHSMGIECLRELSTVVMIGGAAYLAASKFKDRFAYFLLTFAIWDLFYYVWLKVLLDWPASFRTYDLLFLIPWPWVAPVLAPVIASLTMIVLAPCLLSSEKNPNSAEWALWLAGSFVILVTFLSDYGRLIGEGGYFKDFLGLATNPEFQKLVSSHTPGGYNWVLFIVGEAVILAGLYAYHRRTR